LIQTFAKFEVLEKKLRRAPVSHETSKLRAAAMLFRVVPVRAPVGRAGLGHGPMAVRRAVLLACVATVLPTVCAAPVSAPRVCALFLAGVQVVDIASRCRVTARRVNQIVRDAGLRPAVQPKPSAVVLDRIITAETAGLCARGDRSQPGRHGHALQGVRGAREADQARAVARHVCQRAVGDTCSLSSLRHPAGSPMTLYRTALFGRYPFAP